MTDEPRYPAVPPPHAFEMVSDELIEPVYVANDAWTRGQAKAHMANALDCDVTEVSLTRIAMIWDPETAAREYRENHCECGAEVEDGCVCPLHQHGQPVVTRRYAWAPRGHRAEP